MAFQKEAMCFRSGGWRDDFKLIMQAVGIPESEMGN